MFFHHNQKQVQYPNIKINNIVDGVFIDDISKGCPIDRVHPGS